MKRCAKCKKRRQRRSFWKNGCKADGLQSQCKHCRKQGNPIWWQKYKATPGFADKRANYRRLLIYGITPDDFKKLLAKQKGKCAICKKRKQTLHVDHNHKTGKVRGLLCGNCNRGLGLFFDNKKFLQAAIIYL